jgi:hypothetical protein
MKKWFRWSLLVGSVACGAAVAAWYRIPGNKEKLKARWHVWSCPAIPSSITLNSLDPTGHVGYTDPGSFRSGTGAHSPSLHYDFENAATTDAKAFRGNGLLVLPAGSVSPAIMRIKGDVADSLLSISAGFWMQCADRSPDVRIVIRIDGVDGLMCEWNQKRLLESEHTANAWERFNFEWLLRSQVLHANDRITIFIVNDGSDDLLVDEMDIVFRSASIPQQRTPHA